MLDSYNEKSLFFVILTLFPLIAWMALGTFVIWYVEEPNDEFIFLFIAVCCLMLILIFLPKIISITFNSATLMELARIPESKTPLKFNLYEVLEMLCLLCSLMAIALEVMELIIRTEFLGIYVASFLSMLSAFVFCWLFSLVYMRYVCGVLILPKKYFFVAMYIPVLPLVVMVFSPFVRY